MTRSAEDIAATSGFISCLFSSLMNKGGVSAWVGSSQAIFPAALKFFNVEPDKIIFINTKKPKELLWLVEEALKCEGLAAVVGEVAEVTFTESRRLQLAVEQSRVTGFLIRNNSRNINANACTARWKISPGPSILTGDLPGIGFPAWNIELLKIRNGKPGRWQMQWAYNKLHSIPDPIILSSTDREKQDEMQKRFVTIWFRFLKTDWFCRRHPELLHLPFVLIAPDHGRMIITAVNPHAYQQGIVVGMVLADDGSCPSVKYFDDIPGLP